MFCKYTSVFMLSRGILAGRLEQLKTISVYDCPDLICNELFNNDSIGIMEALGWIKKSDWEKFLAKIKIIIDDLEELVGRGVVKDLNLLDYFIKDRCW